MHREILFRAKRVDNNEWVEGYYFETPLTDESTGSHPVDGWFFLTGRHRHCIAKNGCVYEVIRESVGQYTGLTDKNGVKIFEGYVCIRNPYGFTNKSVFSVHYHERHCAFTIADSDGRVKTWLHEITHTHDIEVIGNVTDNPELLGGDVE